MNSTAPAPTAPKKDMSKQSAASRETFARRRIERAMAEIIDQGCSLWAGDGWVVVFKDGEVVYRTRCLPAIVQSPATP